MARLCPIALLVPGQPVDGVAGEVGAGATSPPLKEALHGRTWWVAQSVLADAAPPVCLP